MTRGRITALVGLMVSVAPACTVHIEPTTVPGPEPTVEVDRPVTTSSTGGALALAPRPGDPPSVTDGIPHIQLDQTSSDEMLNELANWAFALDGVVEQPSIVSLPGARALTVASELPVNSEAILAAREFAHIHPQPNGGSLHLRLSQAEAQEVVDKGWGVYHPFAIDGSIPNLIMVFAPRNSEDLVHIKTIIEASVAFATTP